MSNDTTHADDTDPDEQPTTPSPEDADAEDPDLAEAAPDAGGAGMNIGAFLEGGGIKDLLLQETYEDPQTGHTYSQAHLIADIINVMRMDTKQMAALHGIDINVDKMGPERAAELVENLAGSGGEVDIVGVFERIEDQRDLILKQKLTDDQHAEYMQFKRDMLFSVPNDTPVPGGDD